MAAHLKANMQIHAAQLSEAGIKEDNEDCIGLCIPSDESLLHKGAVAVIADGVSTAEAGKEASHTCVSNFISDYFSTPESWSVKQAGQKVLTALNRWLYGQGQNQAMAENKAYISTLSVVIIKSNMAHIFHVGDSRVYLYRQGDLEPLTRDHSARISPQQHYLTRAMGMDVSLEVDYRQVPVQAGDVFFLSTDGVHDFVSTAQLKQDLAYIDAQTNLQQVCQRLLALAKQQQSDDNLSCQLVYIDALGAPDVDEVCLRLNQLPFPPDLSPGMRLDDYEVEALIYASNRSQLYRVREVNSGQHYALKTPSVNFNDDAAYIERFIMEKWIGQRIKNPHVVRAIEPTNSPKFLYYLTDYIAGKTLSLWMKEAGHQEISVVIAVMQQLVKGVRAFHRQEVLHQDLKPDNIIVEANGHVTIIDFGSSYVAGINEISSPIERDIALGTEDYSAPELALLQKPTSLSDQFSLASICYEMLTGKLPYNGKQGLVKSDRDIQKLEYTPAYQHNPLVPVWLDGALKRALKPLPQHRYEALSEFIYDLQQPNPLYNDVAQLPLIERSPVLVWQLVSLLLLLLNLFCLWFFLS